MTKQCNFFLLTLNVATFESLIQHESFSPEHHDSEHLLGVWNGMEDNYEDLPLGTEFNRLDPSEQRPGRGRHKTFLPQNLHNVKRPKVKKVKKFKQLKKLAMKYPKKVAGPKQPNNGGGSGFIPWRPWESDVQDAKSSGFNSFITQKLRPPPMRKRSQFMQRPVPHLQTPNGAVNEANSESGHLPFNPVTMESGNQIGSVSKIPQENTVDGYQEITAQNYEFNTNEVMSENEHMPFGPALLDSHPSFDNMSPQKIRHDYQEVPEQHMTFNPALHQSKLDNGGYVQQGLDDFQVYTRKRMGFIKDRQKKYHFV